MIIDIHTHVDDEELYLSYMRKTYKMVDLAFVLHWYKDDLADIAKFVATKPNLRLIAGVDIDGTDHVQKQLEIIERLFEQKKIIGIKLYPGYQHFYVSDVRITPVAELCQKYNKPLVIHGGDVYDIENEALLKYSNSIHVDELAMKFPGLKIVIAHFGFPYLLECANVVSKNKNVYTDISGTIEDDFPRKEAISLFKEYRRDLQRVFNYFPDIKKKVMFGTDFGNDTGENIPYNEIDLYLELVKQLFSKTEQRHVFAELAKKVFLD